MVVVVLPAQIVHVAGADQRASDLAGDLDDPLVALLLRSEPVLLYLEVDVLGAEDPHQVVGVRACVAGTVVDQALAEARGQAAGEGDDAARPALDLGEVDGRLAALQALQETGGGQLDEVAVAGVVGREQREVVTLGPARLRCGRPRGRSRSR